VLLHNKKDKGDYMSATVDAHPVSRHHLHPLRYVALLVLLAVAIVVLIFAIGVAQNVSSTPTTTSTQQSTEQTSPGGSQNIGAPNQNNTTSTGNSDSSMLSQ
jgi:cytoskeletal protein RodZ